MEIQNWKNGQQKNHAYCEILPVVLTEQASIKLAGIIQIIAYHQSLEPLLVADLPNGIDQTELTMNQFN